MKRWFPLGLLAACGAAFIAGLVWMLQARLETGAVYPPYSSLRADPLGAMAFYEGLARLPGLAVSRDYRASGDLGGAGTVYLQLGGDYADWTSLPQDIFNEVESFVGSGGRLVVVLTQPSPSEIEDLTSPDDASKKDASQPADSTEKADTKADKSGDTAGKKTPSRKPGRKSSTQNDDGTVSVSLKDKWGLDFGFEHLPYSDQAPTTSVRNLSKLNLPQQLDWHSGLYFKDLDPAWQVIYSRGKNPVLIQRKFGAGSVVIATDGYFATNEALRSSRQPALLAWLIGSGHHIVFDESHFGIVDEPGIAGLIRHYHLLGLVGSFILVAGLFIWKNLSSLVPPPEAGPQSAYVTGRGASAGFVNLLRRNLPASEVLATCVAEWKKSSAALRPGAKLAEVQAVLDAEAALPARRREPAQAYDRIAEILRKPAFTSAPPPVLSPPASTP